MRQYLLSVYQPGGAPPPAGPRRATHLLRGLGRGREAAEAYRRATTLTGNEAERRFLTARLASLPPTADHPIRCEGDGDDRGAARGPVSAGSSTGGTGELFCEAL